MLDGISCRTVYGSRTVVAFVEVSQQIPHLPIPCKVYSMNSGGSCAGCMNQSVRNVSSTLNTGMVSPHYEVACVRSNDVCA